PQIRDAEVLTIALHAWPRWTSSQRLEAIEAVLARPAISGMSDPREAVMQLLRRGMTDPSPEVRSRTLQAMSANVPLWSGRAAVKLVLSSLADEAPAIRRLGISLASSRSDFWSSPEAREYFKNLLVDPDAEVRAAALEVAEHERLIPWY